MLPALQRLRLGPCRTGMDATDSDDDLWEVDSDDDLWKRNVRQRVEALREAMPDLSPDLVRAVLAEIDTGDANAKNTCRTVSAWCAANRNHRAACLDAGPVFAALTAAVFTAHAPTLVANDARANFNALCNRIKDYQTGQRMLQAHPMEASIRPFVRAAVQFNPVAALSAAPAFHTSYPIMQEAVQIDGMALQFGFRNSIHMCMLAVAQDGLALQFVGDNWRTLRTDVTLRAVQQNGLALQYALAPTTGVQEVVFAAVRQNGNALQYATHYRLLHQDYALVMEAVKNKGGALRWAGWLKKDNENIVHAAVVNDGSAIEYASERLQADPAIRAAAAAQVRYGASAEGAGVVAF